MKRIVYFLLIMILAVSLVFVSCENEPENNDTNDNESSENTDNNDNNGSGDSGDNNGDNSGDNGGEPGEPVNVIASEDYFRTYNGILYLSFDNNFVFPASFTIPSQIKGETYTKIGNGIFKDREDVVSVTIPACVEEIGLDAFSGCSNLKSVTIPDSVKKKVTIASNSALTWGASLLKV